MAFMNQEKKKQIATNLKKVVPKNWKYTLAVRHHSTIVMTVSEAPVDVIGFIQKNYEQKIGGHASINEFWYKQHLADAPAEFLATLEKIFAALNDGNHDRSDIQSDYFDVGWYVDLDFGKWNKPFVNTTA